MKLNQLLQQQGVTLEKASGEHVFMQGDTDTFLYYIQSGLLKAYYTSEDGKESVKSFLLPNNIIGSLTATYSGGYCSFSLICLEPTVLIKIPFQTLQQYSQSDLDIANDMLELLLQFAMKKEKREFELLCLTAEQRYRDIANNAPSLLEKITQNDLARYLGVTPVGLSRIKKRTQTNLI